MDFKDKEVFKAIMSVPYHYKLTDMVWDINEFCNSQHIPELILTSGYREKRVHSNDSGIHSTLPCRAIDFRSSVYTDEQIEMILNYVNKWWIYDTDRPHIKCLIFHDVGLGAHFHAQVHPNTIKREDEQWDS